MRDVVHCDVIKNLGCDDGHTNRVLLHGALDTFSIVHC